MGRTCGGTGAHFGTKNERTGDPPRHSLATRATALQHSELVRTRRACSACWSIRGSSLPSGCIHVCRVPQREPRDIYTALVNARLLDHSANSLLPSRGAHESSSSREGAVPRKVPIWGNPPLAKSFGALHATGATVRALALEAHCGLECLESVLPLKFLFLT